MFTRTLSYSVHFLAGSSKDCQTLLQYLVRLAASINSLYHLFQAIMILLRLHHWKEKKKEKEVEAGKLSRGQYHQTYPH